MLKIWGRASSINVQKVMWLVAELGIAHERVDAGGVFGKTDTPEFAKLNPSRLVPVIEDGEFSLCESGAIIRYLAARHGRGTLLPDTLEGVAKADQWMEWTAFALYGDIISTLFWGLVRTSAAERNVAAIATAEKRAGDRLAILDAHLAGRPYILGDHLTVADIPAGALMYRYFTLPIARPPLPNVAAWYARLGQRAAYAKHVMIDYSTLKVPGA